MAAPSIPNAFFNHLYDAGPADFLAALPGHPGCEKLIVDRGVLQHYLRTMKDDDDATAAFVAAVLAGKPNLKKAKAGGDGTVLEALVRARKLDGRIELINTALELGGDPHLVEGHRRSSAWLAAKELKDKAVLALFEGAAGAPVAAKTLREAVDADDAEAVKQLLTGHKAGPGDAEVLVSALMTEKKVAALLLERRVGIAGPKGGRTALHAAAMKGDPAVVSQLLALGADADAVDATDRDLTPTQYAAQFATHRPEALALLLEKSRVTAKDVCGEKWEWLWFSFGANAVKLLAEKFGATLTATKSKVSVLHLAAASGDAKVVSALLAQGAVVTGKTAKNFRFAGVNVVKGATPLKVATLLKKTAVLAVL